MFSSIIRLLVNADLSRSNDAVMSSKSFVGDKDDAKDLIVAVGDEGVDPIVLVLILNRFSGMSDIDAVVSSLKPCVGDS